jgi:predicted nucleic-acid-binding protein
MIGLDANVLLRLFVEDDAGQSVRARRHVGSITTNEPCLVNSVALAEFAWALAKKMKQTRDQVARLIEEVMSADDLYIPDRRAAERALATYRMGKADFPDSLLAEINLELGCASTATFDQTALDHSAFSPVP